MFILLRQYLYTSVVIQPGTFGGLVVIMLVSLCQAQLLSLRGAGQWEEGTRGGFGLFLWEKIMSVLWSWQILCAAPLRDFPFPCRLSHQEKDQISAQVAALKDTYQALCTDTTEQLQQLQSQLAQETEHKVLKKVLFGCVSRGCPLARGCPPIFSVQASPGGWPGGWWPSRSPGTAHCVVLCTTLSQSSKKGWLAHMVGKEVKGLQS